MNLNSPGLQFFLSPRGEFTFAGALLVVYFFGWLLGIGGGFGLAPYFDESRNPEGFRSSQNVYLLVAAIFVVLGLVNLALRS